ncbi:hypothetical protein H318_14698 [Enterococcus durans IPLA 655]|uniref:ABC transporter permease n=1 Tax=Enterococcus durans TaxID=53345 RepID=UPI0003284D6E|nr:ABC transporter permease [Enterococcus durans]EMS74324.1 hypothetical protein H318_14698 [Enterococcus durans IPLA 655]
MFNQWKHDSQYIFYSKKHRGIVGLTIILSIFLVINSSTSGSGLSLDAYREIFSSFRQLFWIISVFVITDLVSTDYHSKTLKNVLHRSNSRIQYIMSKIGVATLFSLLLLMIHFSTIFGVLQLASSNAQFIFFEVPWLILGALSGLIFFASILTLVLILFENEAVTMGFAVGTTLLLMLAEAPSFSFYRYLPTMLVNNLESTIHSNSLVSFSVLIGYFVLAFLTILVTMKIFNKKDIFT